MSPWLIAGFGALAYVGVLVLALALAKSAKMGDESMERHARVQHSGRHARLEDEGAAGLSR